MNQTLSNSTKTKISETNWQALRERILPLAALMAILLLAAVLRFVNIDSLGYVNHYYAAAVKSMLQSWHNFFFAAAEPGGSVSVDKPPVGLWLQAISAYFLGVNSLGLLLPQILAGLASVILIYHLVQRTFGKPAGLIAALALAITPVVVATDRNNTMDSTMIFTLLLAAWAFIKATETSKMRYLMLGSVLVGIAFNIKMLAAYLPLPAFFGLYFLGAREKFWRKIGKLVITGLLLLAISFSWALIVDLTPEDQRPYVGSSSDNSEFTLIFGYNGLTRLIGMARNRFLSARRTNPPLGSTQPGSGSTGLQIPGNRPQVNPPQNNLRQLPPDRPGAIPGNIPANRSAGGGGGFNIGRPGALRLFTAPLSKEASWLLPLGLVSMLILLVGSRLCWPVNARHQALLVWGGWLITAAVFFSVASFFHEYYLSLMGAPLAALVGIGLMELWALRKQRPLFASILIIAIVGCTFGFQFLIAGSFVNAIHWLPLVIAAFLMGTVVLLVALDNKTSQILSTAGLILLIISMFITPAIWSWYTALSAGSNLSLPAAYTGQISNPANRGDVHVNQRLLQFLMQHTQDIKYLMAVPSSMQGADYVLATGRPVLYMGGFNGNDAVVDTDDLTQLVQDGELRYIYWGSQGGAGKSEITIWLNASCTSVKGFETATRNFGAPDGTVTAPGNAPRGQENDIPIALYDCAP